MTGRTESARASAGRLLGLGIRAAFSTPLAVLGVALTVAAAEVAQAVIFPTMFLADGEDDVRLVVLGAVGLVVLAALARGIALAWAVRTAAERMRGGAWDPDQRAAAATGLTGLFWAVGAAAVQLTLSLTFWTGLAATGMVYLVGKTPLALLGAAGLAGVLAVGAVLGPVLSLWLEVALARAVARGEGIAVAGAEAWRTLGERPGFVVVAWLATALPAMAVAAMVQSFLGMAPPPSWPVVLAQASGLLLLALIEAVATVGRLDSYAALELDRAGVLPVPPTPAPVVPPVPRATLVQPSTVVQARLVPPPDPGMSG